MDSLARDYLKEGVGAIFLYTHEAHPGEHYPHLTSFAQKLEHARQLRDVLRVRRDILLDALDGDCHRAYGSMPNMTWIFDQRGVPLYKSDWTDVHSVQNAVDYLVETKRRRRNGARLAPFRVERVDFREVDREAFYRGLERNGPKAVKEFSEAFG